ncbi:MAG: LysE family transporter [Marmoricola sp.]
MGFGAHKLADPLSDPKTWRIIDSLIGVLMVVLAVYLLNF